MFFTHNLGNYGQSCSLTGLTQQFKAIGTHSLEVVGRGSGLEGAAAQKCCARCLYGLCNAYNLLLGFNRAGTGNHGKVAAADLYLVLTLTDLDDCVGGVEAAVGAFERLADAGN